MPLPTRTVTTYFGLGLTFGLVIAFLLTSYPALITITRRYGQIDINQKLHDVEYDVNASRLGSETVRTRENRNREASAMIGTGSVHSHEELDKIKGPDKEFHFKDEHLHHDDDHVAKSLYDKVRVLCWVMTSPDNLEKKAIHVRATWGKRCNKLLFMSSVTNSSFPTIGLNVSEGREHLTAKTMKAFRYVAEHYMDDADWFVKADDDTYMILENLRYFLSDIDSDTPIFYGHHFKVIVKQGYFSGGGGYVLSKEALRRFYAKGQKNCRADGGAEDAEFGRCMESLGVKTGYSLDALGRSRFHCFDPETHLFGGYPPWYYKYDAHGAKKGMESISDYAITFHYIPPNKMYAMEFYIYHLRPYGLMSNSQNLNVNQTTTK